VCTCSVHTREGQREQTGSPTATLKREILLTPALSLTLSLKVSLGDSKLPYAVPDHKKINSRFSVPKMKQNKIVTHDRRMKRYKTN